MNDTDYAYYTFPFIKKFLRNSAFTSFWPGETFATPTPALRLKRLLTCGIQPELLTLNSARPTR
jgi:hypothetical protein